MEIQRKTAILLIMVIAIFGFSCSTKNKKPPLAQKGAIDLSQWNFEEEGNIKLDGEWEFYWEKLYTTEDFSQKKLIPDTIVTCPSLWNNYSIKGKTLSGLGFATYRLIANTSNKTKHFGIRITYQETAYNLFVNGKLVVKNGKVSNDLKKMVPYWSPQIADFKTDQEEIEFILQISNGFDRKGGFRCPLLIGSPNKIRAEKDYFFTRDAILAGVLLIMCLYSFGLFFFRQKDNASLYFSILCLMLLIRTITTDERLLLNFLPDISWEVFVKLMYSPLYLGSIALLLFFKNIFTKEVNKKVLLIYVVLFSIYFFSGLISSIYFNSLLIPSFKLVYLTMLLYLIVILYKAIRKKHKGAILIGIGFSVFFLTSLNDIFHDQALIHTGLLVPFGFFAFIITQAFALSIHVFQVEKDRADLEQTVTTINLLSEIGKQVTSNLSVDIIMQTVYKNVISLMQADSFAIGILNQKKNALIFFSITKSLEVLKKTKSLNNKDALSVQCYSKRQELLLENHSVNYKKSSIEQNSTEIDDYFYSHIYIPLIIKDEVKGVLSVHNKQKNAYTNYHLNLLRNIGIYSAIGLDNANAYEHIENQKTKIEYAHKQITDSLYYASKIQNAVLPDNATLALILPEHFILYKPRDIVSGDFYWIKQIKNFTIVATVDCTGHGVPGAFMSMLGGSFLNEIVTPGNLNSTGEILNRLRIKVKKSLHQKGREGEQKDGMDIAFYIIDTETLKLQFSGAYNPLYIIRQTNNETSKEPKSKNAIISQVLDNKELIELKATRQPIAIYDNERDFLTYKFQLKKGDCLYTFTDGFADQFGGNEGRKFKYKNFKKLLVDNCNKPMQEQHTILDNTIERWKNGQEQVDDILVIGVKIN